MVPNPIKMDDLGGYIPLFLERIYLGSIIFYIKQPTRGPFNTEKIHLKHPKGMSGGLGCQVHTCFEARLKRVSRLEGRGPFHSFGGDGFLRQAKKFVELLFPRLLAS